MRVNGVIGVIIVGFVALSAIIVGNYFFEQFLGVNVSKLPMGLKFIIHLCGLAAVAFVLKKFFRK